MHLTPYVSPAHLPGEAMANRTHDTHDSIEDARTALALYDKYRELERSGTVQQTLQHLYDVGRDTHWEVPDFMPPPRMM